MRSHEVFARMGPEHAQRFLEEVREDAPDVALIALNAASNAFKLRPKFLGRQPRARQAEWVRRALARRAANSIAEETLALYFLDKHKDLLVELLEALGVPHEDGQLTDPEPPCPDPADLEKALDTFRKAASDEDRERRELLLSAFAAQSSVDWPELEKRLA